jgi:hypothetical protein
MLLDLPKEIALHCCEYLPSSDIYKMRTIVSSLQKIKCFYDHVNYIKNKFPISIVIAMGGFEKFLSFPILEWRNDFMGFTDYIDRILPSDVFYPIMIGTDCYQRSFITLKLKKNLEQEFVITMFQ